MMNMTPPQIDVAIIGAGPYGLSLAAHLKDRGAEFRIFGSPMRFWLDMAPGISLKSFDFATNVYTPRKGYRFVEYCRDRNIDSHEPCAMSLFSEYGLWAQRELVPEVEDVQVTHVVRQGDGFQLTLSTGEEVDARRVVVAVGLANFPRVPQELKISSSRISHTSQVHDYEQFRGMDVTVIGGGQSALEAAGLLTVHGATSRVLVRSTGGWFSGKLPPTRTLRERWSNPLTTLGPGRLNWVLANLPWLARYLPDDKRIRLTRKHLGPFGTWWVRDQIGDSVPILMKTRVVSAVDRGDRIALTVSGLEGEQELLTDHVIAGTGYEVDVDRIPFLDPALCSSITRIERAPRLSRNFQSSVDGLYFIGPAAAFSFGPLLRFACGAEFAAPRLSRHLAARTQTRAAPVRSTAKTP
jgi:cation diffusion facilitator CzcD-associated flavoprotein CzcO